MSTKKGTKKRWNRGKTEAFLKRNNIFFSRHGSKLLYRHNGWTNVFRKGEAIKHRNIICQFSLRIDSGYESLPFENSQPLLDGGFISREHGFILFCVHLFGQGVQHHVRSLVPGIERRSVRYVKIRDDLGGTGRDGAGLWTQF